MGEIRNGARKFLNIMAIACKLSKMNGFRSGVINILGPETAASFFALWDPLCAFIDLLVGTDNWFNQRDMKDDDSTGEDAEVGPAAAQLTMALEGWREQNNANHV